MSETLESLGHKITGANELHSVVKTMKVIAASRIRQYDIAVEALQNYYHTVQMGLSVCLKQERIEIKYNIPGNIHNSYADIIIFGSDQGLVGRFNDHLIAFAKEKLADIKTQKQIWAVGELMFLKLTDATLKPAGKFPVPASINTITPLIGQILTQSRAYNDYHASSELYLFYNQPVSDGVYEPFMVKLLPLDQKWEEEMSIPDWPTKNLPQPIGDTDKILGALVREFLFVSLFRACAESLASENATRLMSMQRAEKKVEEQLTTLNMDFHRIRQSSIDEELFDVVSGFDALHKR